MKRRTEPQTPQPPRPPAGETPSVLDRAGDFLRGPWLFHTASIALHVLFIVGLVGFAAWSSKPLSLIGPNDPGLVTVALVMKGGGDGQPEGSGPRAAAPRPTPPPAREEEPEPRATPQASPPPRATEAARTEAPRPEPQSSPEPDASPEPTPPPAEEKPEAILIPKATPKPKEQKPKATPKASASPRPEPTKAARATPKATEAPKATQAPKATEAPKATQAARATEAARTPAARPTPREEAAISPERARQLRGHKPQPVVPTPRARVVANAGGGSGETGESGDAPASSGRGAPGSTGTGTGPKGPGRTDGSPLGRAAFGSPDGLIEGTSPVGSTQLRGVGLPEYYGRSALGQIGRNFEVPNERQTNASATLAFKIRRDGTIADVAVRRSTGRSDLDALAVAALERTRSLPPLPDSFEKDEVSVEVTFAFRP